MPNRIIREGLLTSDAVSALSPPAEVLFVHLLLAADDFGRFDARLPILLSRLFPLKRSAVSEEDVERWLAECVTAGLVRTYTVGGKPYLEVPKFDQRVRAKVSKYPAPPADAGHAAGTCQTDDGHVTDTRQTPGGPSTAICPTDDMHAIDTGRLETETETESKTKTKASGQTAASAELPHKSPEFAKAWAEWVQYRKEARKALTPSTIAKQLNDLGKLPEQAAIEMISNSILKGWQGLYPPTNGSPASGQPKQPPQRTRDKL